MQPESTRDLRYEELERRAVLVGVCLPDEHRFERRMKELEGLAEAAGIEVVGFFSQNLKRPDAAYYIGTGKVEEIRLGAETLDANLVLFNNQLSPAQLRNLSEAVGLEVIDRTNLILTIFAERARSNEAKMQIDYAKLKYSLPRLVGLREGLSRQGGTAGSLSNRGSGEKKIELDRRKIEKQMSLLRHDLDELATERRIRRSKRAASGLPLVSLVGYTNAGKSTLLNRLLALYSPEAAEEKSVLAKDMLFATLDTSIRRIEPPNMAPFLLSDTVGFIDQLPTLLIDAFRSTLDEAVHADLLLQVVDSCDPECEEHIKVTEQILAELEVGDVPMIYVMNKADELMRQNAEAEDAVPLYFPQGLPCIRGNRIYLSAKSGEGITELLEMIAEELNRTKITTNYLIPYTEGGLENRIREQGVIHEIRYEAEGIRISATLEPKDAGALKAYIVEE